MKKVYRLDGVDCAACASKMEIAVSKLDGVESANLNFLTEKLVVVYNDVEDKASIEKAIKTVDKHVKIK